MRRLMQCALLVLIPISAHLSVLGQAVVPRILNGQPTDNFESVGIVGTTEFGGFCSGTLITPIHVLTAAHCAELAADQTLPVPFPAMAAAAGAESGENEQPAADVPQKLSP